ncbi:uncharacterized protein BDV17DRAFT_277999 [Aspergillus undulatus]|uniref:uncharacterized protein n=1 Tax=Aspergillus undulatus TaxID=1810928 RepID=UPI003CCD619D
MSNRSQRMLAPAYMASPPIAPRHIVKRTKASRPCSACRGKRSTVSIYIFKVSRKEVYWLAAKFSLGVLAECHARSAARIILHVLSTLRLTTVGEYC